MLMTLIMMKLKNDKDDNGWHVMLVMMISYNEHRQQTAESKQQQHTREPSERRPGEICSIRYLTMIHQHHHCYLSNTSAAAVSVTLWNVKIGFHLYVCALCQWAKRCLSVSLSAVCHLWRRLCVKATAIKKANLQPVVTDLAQWQCRLIHASSAGEMSLVEKTVHQCIESFPHLNCKMWLMKN